MKLKTCTTCGSPFQPRYPRAAKCPAHEQSGRDQRSPTTRAQRDNGSEYERNRVIVLAGSPMCFYECGRSATTADHKIPVAAGGSNHLTNLVPACAPCNARKQATQGWSPRRS